MKPKCWRKNETFQVSPTNTHRKQDTNLKKSILFLNHALRQAKSESTGLKSEKKKKEKEKMKPKS